MLLLNYFPLVPHPLLHPVHPPSPAFLPCFVFVFPFPARRRGTVGGKHERGVFGGGGEIVAGERSEHGPGRLLEAQRLLTSLEGTHK